MRKTSKNDSSDTIPFSRHTHGGQLTQASQKYDIPLAQWLDLSTGINPNAYPLPPVPSQYWQRLPEANDGLELAAYNYYGSKSLLPVSGSQEAIQKLPLIFKNAQALQVGLVAPAYHSHQKAWQKAGHEIILLSDADIDSSLDSLDVLVLVTPTNPSCIKYKREELLQWHQQLARKKGVLIVDEAFIDTTPENSLVENTPKTGLIVLRSIGKFFGLAGIRLGFVWAEATVLQQLHERQDDWSVSNPARWAGKIALEDTQWQQQQRLELPKQGLRLAQVLTDFLSQYNIHKQNISAKMVSRGVTETTKERSDADPKGEVKPHKSGGVSFNRLTDDSFDHSVKNTDLFAYFEHPDAPLIHERLAQSAILTRLIKESPQQKTALRFGLPAKKSEWQRLQESLDSMLND